MKKILAIFSVLAFSVVTTGFVLASGWRIPEQSVDSLAKVGANVASAKRADMAYYNPAKMGKMSDQWQIEADLTYIYLTEVDYDDIRRDIFDHTSEAEHFLVPTGFMVSPDYNGARFGLAVVAPYGLAKHWKNGYGEAFVKEFGLKVIEVNPTISYDFGDMISVAAGPRILWADGSVKSDARFIGKELSRDMTGQTVEWGWNVAVNVQPIDGLDLAVTYRSYIDLFFEDSAVLNLMGNRLNPDAELSIPAPASLAVSVAYDVYENVNVEFTWDRTFWSEYKTFDFNFTPDIPKNPFEAPVVRNWEDSDAFRLGVTYRVNEYLEILAGLGYDKTPIPLETLDFSVPGANAWLYSLGVRYRVNEQLEVGFSALYDKKEKRQRKINPEESIYGSFSNAAAILFTAGVTYSF